VIPSVLLAIDPGIRGCGMAVFDHGMLAEAAYVVNPCKEGNGAAEASSMASWVVGTILGRWYVSEIAVEWPRVYAARIREGKTKEDPNDLLALTAVDAAIVALLAPATAKSYAPSDWKGQMDKDVCHARVVTRLSSSELAVAETGARAAKSKAHNMYDAVGIGLHHLGRFDRKRVIP
jgi:hypothetical protein